MKKFLKIRPIYLIICLCILVVGFGLVILTAQKNDKEYRDMQLAAAERMEKAEAYLKEKILAKGIEIEPLDLNQTGLIGPEFSELMTTPGEEGAKRSALNPEFAAAMVRYFHEAGVQEGDAIAIGTSGSFPGFVIATLCAATEMHLDTRLIASVGASMNGATRPEFTVFDIIDTLEEGGFASFHLLGVSCGGDEDLGGSAAEDILYVGTKALFEELCEDFAKRKNVEWIHEPTLAQSIQRRLVLYGDGIKLFINIGGAAPNSGHSSYTLDFPQGLVLEFPKIPDVDTRGLNYEYAALDVPVLNLLNVKLLCQENNIPFDPVPLSHAGETTVYSDVVYNKALIVETLVLACLSLLVGFLEKFLIKRRSQKKAK